MMTCGTEEAAEEEAEEEEEEEEEEEDDDDDDDDHDDNRRYGDLSPHKTASICVAIFYIPFAVGYVAHAASTFAKHVVRTISPLLVARQDTNRS
jgi:ABC-type Zn2+ transport system substrate-binding protein/surface adhesin